MDQVTTGLGVAHRHAVGTLTWAQSNVALLQVGLVLVTAALVLWAILFSNYPLVHDTFHELRHSLYFVPCH
ncbi:MAG: CbtB-domain containing protein [Ardenticatenia bacterium]|nr:CbtB-domain containing protein [Ardenticatenia bacterium]